MVTRRPTLASRSRLDDLIGIRVKYLPYRDRAKEESTSESQQQSHSINICVRVHRHMDRLLGNGCHALSPLNSTTLPHSPTTPPISEISTASVNSCRKMRVRLAPSASRRATSRERSAARAANRLPRLAQAASRINPASSINPAMNARIGLPR